MFRPMGPEPQFHAGGRAFITLPCFVVLLADVLPQFYEYGGGSVFQVAADANGVTYNPATPVPSPKSASSSTTDTSGSSAASVTTVPNGALEFYLQSTHCAAALAVAGGMVLGASSFF